MPRVVPGSGVVSVWAGFCATTTTPLEKRLLSEKCQASLSLEKRPVVNLGPDTPPSEDGMTQIKAVWGSGAEASTGQPRWATAPAYCQCIQRPSADSRFGRRINRLGIRHFSETSRLVRAK